MELAAEMRTHLAADTAEVSAVDVGGRVGAHKAVGEVVGLQPKLEREPFGDLRPLCQNHVDVREPRPVNSVIVPWIRAAGKRRQVREDRSVEHLLAVRVAQYRIPADLEAAESQKFTAEIFIDTADLPAADDLL